MVANCGLRASIGLALMLCFAAVAGLASAAERQNAVGRWYGEVNVKSTYGNKPFDFRRWLRINRADGTGQTTMRYYLGTTYQTETMETFKWGLAGDTYWEECVSVKDDDGTRTCSNKTQYDIKKLTDREFLNASKRTGIEYREIKVPAEFALP